MPTPKHQAFLDLENSIDARLRRAWAKGWSPLAERIQQALDDEDYALAERLSQQIDMEAPVRKSLSFLKTMGLAAVLLGVSRRASIRDSRIAKTPPDVIDKFLRQFEVMLGRNGTERLRQTAHDYIEEIRAAPDAERTPFITVVNMEAKSMTSIAASLMTSRLSAYGILSTALEHTDWYYEISATLDDVTCPVCRIMDGKVFPVTEGHAHVEHLLSLTDPASLKQAAPFWSHKKEALAELATYSRDDLIEAGMLLPPFHPRCRCIVIPSDRSIAEGDVTGRTANMLETLYGKGTDSHKGPIPQRQLSIDPALLAALVPPQGYTLTQHLYGASEPPPPAPAVIKTELVEGFERSTLLGRIVSSIKRLWS